MAAKKRKHHYKKVTSATTAPKKVHHRRKTSKKISKSIGIPRTLKKELVSVIKNLEKIKDEMPGPEDWG